MMQQALSDKYGIVTFTRTGGISTVSRTTATTPLSFNQFPTLQQNQILQKLSNNINNAVSKILSTGGRIGNTIFDPPENAPGNPGSGMSNTPKDPALGSAGNTDRIIESLDQFKNFLGPTGLIAAIALGAVILLKRK